MTAQPVPSATSNFAHPYLEVLLVDDDAAHVELVRRNLSRVGCIQRIVPLASGAAALAYLDTMVTGHARHPATESVMLLDINMPGSIDGIEVLRRVKTHPDLQQLPVIMLTTSDDPREVARCYALGCNAYITKPVAPEAFVEVITRLGKFLEIATLPVNVHKEQP